MRKGLLRAMQGKESQHETQFKPNPVQNLSFEPHWAHVQILVPSLKIHPINGPNTGFWCCLCPTLWITVITGYDLFKSFFPATFQVLFLQNFTVIFLDAKSIQNFSTGSTLQNELRGKKHPYSPYNTDSQKRCQEKPNDQILYLWFPYLPYLCVWVSDIQN